MALGTRLGVALASAVLAADVPAVVARAEAERYLQAVTNLGRREETARVLGPDWATKAQDYAALCQKLPGCSGECGDMGAQPPCRRSPLAEKLWKPGEPATTYIRRFLRETAVTTRKSLTPEERLRLTCALGRLGVDAATPGACEAEYHHALIELLNVALDPARADLLGAAFCAETAPCAKDCARTLHTLLEGKPVDAPCAELAKLATTGEATARVEAASRWGRDRLVAYAKEVLPSLSPHDRLALTSGLARQKWTPPVPRL